MLVNCLLIKISPVDKFDFLTKKFLKFLFIDTEKFIYQLSFIN
jgi:hypothetical protein